MARGRPKGELTRNDGTWTEAKFKSFVKNNLRAASRKWGPIQKCKKRANVSRGLYKCEGCGETVPPTVYDEEKKKRVTNTFVDHVVPIVDPAKGFVSWDEIVDRMYCDSSNLQLLCKDCHKKKSQEEIDIAKARRASEKSRLQSDDWEVLLEDATEEGSWD